MVGGRDGHGCDFATRWEGLERVGLSRSLRLENSFLFF